ncbi:uncharacterized protein EV420DRAFT_874863 [Desarmillaria tabescens]|uniref:Uncharacterized protein n=1 Tax=Armillaria tabescens TaxID=1929756 RepID=A0AA39JTB8_ARMTA|nr:uncharacterized protein EV420DRAFT_874863 [Desarmillaria tabescens]KAK0447431.1 hypothetical protein EV420DRAFT_874863 [Desarmillaria tabescens]
MVPHLNVTMHFQVFALFFFALVAAVVAAPVKRETNAQRFAKGLPPLKPWYLYKPSATSPMNIPSGVPSGKPSGVPYSKPSGIPWGKPSGIPYGKPSGIPYGRPSGIPSSRPSGWPRK